ncbi:helicase associated domain-containing protein [Micromonospora sp. NPDC000207]|uniref:helicase associated domain-containing protein n=1 Tax=Micromonospora sp. NPDC000207 TaxID=3154246 RepID=UPI00332C8900
MHSRDWDAGYAAAAEFCRDFGHLNVPEGGEYAGVNLSWWLRNRRRDYRLGRIAPEKVTALDRLGIEWEPQDAAWRQGLAAARTYVRRHGHLRVPVAHVEDSVRLGAWLAQQRYQKRRGTLPAGRGRELDELDTDWCAERPRGRRPGP